MTLEPGPGRRVSVCAWLKELLGPNLNLYLLAVVLAILAAGAFASRLHRPRASAARADTGGTTATDAPA